MENNDIIQSSIIQNRLHRLRRQMKNDGIDLALIRSTDNYLNEYVPSHLSERVFISGFTGSMGDVLIAEKEAFLFIDGRYALQAQKEAPHFECIVAPLGVAIEQTWLNKLGELASIKPCSLAKQEDCIPVLLFQKMSQIAQANQVRLVCPKPSLTERVRRELGLENRPLEHSPVWPVPTSITGATPKERLKRLQNFLIAHQLDAFLCVPLDEIAWLTNLRGKEFAYQSTFAAVALFFQEEIWVETRHQKPAELPHLESISFLPFSSLAKQLADAFKGRLCRLGLDPAHTPQALHDEFKERGIQIVFLPSPLRPLKAEKTPEELAHMRQAFAKADKVVLRTQKWARHQVMQKIPITESDIKKKVEQEFHDSGTRGLSFKPICAGGKNSAVIHYNTKTSSSSALAIPTLFLLDVGGLYEGGYATDLTRTFWLSAKKEGPKDYHKQAFTYVLKAAIAGMSVRFPKGTLGSHLDAIVRAPLWKHGIQFGHGVGHGVGIQVHESPPSISPGSKTPIQIGHVFSIEPGCYFPDFGGVRIENLCTVVPDPERESWLQVVPLTFAPLDEYLIEKKLLTPYEKSFLRYYKSCFYLKDRKFPPLPPREKTFFPS